MAGVLVVGEVNGDALQSITGELLAAGRGIGDASGEEVAVVLLNGSEAAGQAAIALGADKAYLAQDDVLADLQLDAQVAALAKVCDEAQPSVVLIGRTLSGRDVGPRLAFRLGVGLAQDCLEVAADGDSGKVVAVRPVYGGNALAKVTFPDASPQMVVMRGKAYEPLDADESRTGEIAVINTELDPSVVKARLVETVRQESEGVRPRRREHRHWRRQRTWRSGAVRPTRRLGGAAWRRGGRIARSVRRRLARPQLPSGLDRQDHHARPVHHGRHIRREPAHGGLLGVQEHRRHQPRRGCQHLQKRQLRRRRRLEERPAIVHRDSARACGFIIADNMSKES